jgi:hypothetical protein
VTNDFVDIGFNTSTMGWYHHEYANGAAPSDDGTCALPSPDASREESAKEELYLESGVIYHLCQRSLWLQAIESKQPYFPPTFWSDGRFTRGSVVRSSIVHTANTYYKEVSGDWLCIELNALILRQQGIAIAVHRAPEAAQDGQPAQCLKLYGGISVTTLCLVTEIFALQRGSNGLFLGMLPDDGAPRMARSQENPSANSSGTVKSEIVSEQSTVSQHPEQPPQKRGFWPRKK